MTHRGRAGAILVAGAFILLSLPGGFSRALGAGDPPAGKMAHPRVESALLELAERHAAGAPQAQAFARTRGIASVESGRITVYLLADPREGGAPIDVEALRTLGGRVIKSSRRVLKASIPLGRIREIADGVPGVAFLRLPDRPRAEAVVGEGPALTRATNFHTAGYTGAGVNVAVIDLGFAGLSSAIANGDLPETVVRVDCTGDNCVSTPTTFDSGETESHGVAVAEVVAEMAPGARLYLIKIGDVFDLLDAKNFCIDNGVRVINHSVGWVNTNFYDGACWFDVLPVCTANNAFANGILWVNSAGNSARKHYEATFADGNGDGLHDQTVALTAAVGDEISLSLTWEGWPVSADDYDLLLLDPSGASIASGANPQTGTQPPTERIDVTSAPSTGTYTVRVRKSVTAAVRRLKLFSFGGNLSPSVARSSMTSPADAAGVVAVAAIDYQQWVTGPQESFSSQGPTTDGRVKPELSGPDGVSGWTLGARGSTSGGFFGTSAASPHVAGAAALILSRHPTFAATDLWNVLVSSAVDMGDPGTDNVFGAGRLNLVSPPGEARLISPADGATGQPTQVTLLWRRSTDPDGDTVTYHVYVGTDNSFAGAIPIDVASLRPARRYASASGMAGCFPLLAILPAIGVCRRRKGIALLVGAALLGAALLFSCGGQSENGGILGRDPEEALRASTTVSGLSRGTTYYWKVVSDDGTGQRTDSDIFRFTTAD